MELVLIQVMLIRTLQGFDKSGEAGAMVDKFRLFRMVRRTAYITRSLFMHSQSSFLCFSLSLSEISLSFNMQARMSIPRDSKHIPHSQQLCIAAGNSTPCS